MNAILDYFTAMSLFSSFIYVAYLHSHRVEKSRQKIKLLENKVLNMEKNCETLLHICSEFSHQILQPPQNLDVVEDIKRIKEYVGLSDVIPQAEVQQQPQPVVEVVNNPTPQLTKPQILKAVEMPTLVESSTPPTPPTSEGVESDTSSESSSDDEEEKDPNLVRRDFSEEIDIINSLKKYEGGFFKEFMFAIDNKKLKYKILRINGNLVVDPEKLVYDPNVVGVFVKEGENNTKIIEKISDVGGVKV